MNYFFAVKFDASLHCRQRMRSETHLFRGRDRMDVKFSETGCLH